MKKTVLMVFLLLVAFTGCLEPDRSTLACEYRSLEAHDGEPGRSWYIKEPWLKQNITGWDELSDSEKESLRYELRNWSYIENRNISSENNKSALVDKVLRWYKRDLNRVGNMTRYNELTDADKSLFDRAVQKEIDVSESEMRSFLPGSDIYGGRYIVYRNEIYHCYNTAPRGTA